MHARLVGLLLTVPLVASAETQIQRVGEKIGVRATASPLSEVLDRIASQTGMKLVYDGPAPRARISLALPEVTPVQAVLGVLEGQGLTYVLTMDTTGTRVETLMVVSGGGASPAAAPGPATPRDNRVVNDDNEPDDEPEAAPVPGSPPSEDDGGARRPANLFQPPGVPQPPPPGMGGQTPGIVQPPPGVGGPVQPLMVLPPSPGPNPPPGKVQQ